MVNNMEPISLISSIRDELVKLKDQGIDKVSIDKIIHYLSQLEITIENMAAIKPTELEHYKAQLLMWIENQKSQSQIFTEGFRSVILSAQNALRSSILINGGASVALLTFIGKLNIEANTQVNKLAFPLLIFVIGVLVSAINSGFTYLTQWFYFGGVVWKEKLGFYLNIINIILAIASYSLFAIGTWFTYKFFAYLAY